MALLVEMRSGRDYWVGAYGPLLVLFWTREVDSSVYYDLIDVCRKVAARQEGGRLSVLSVALPGARTPGSESRQAMVALLRETDCCVSRVAIVREGQGFVASVVASIAMGVQLLAKPLAGHRFFSVLDEAMVWATNELPDFKSGKTRFDDARAIVEQQRKSLVVRLAATG